MLHLAREIFHTLALRNTVPAMIPAAEIAGPGAGRDAIRSRAFHYSQKEQHMELITQYTGASMQSVAPDPWVDRVSPKNMPSTQAKIFPEPDVGAPFAMKPDKQPVDAALKGTASPRIGDGKASPHSEPALDRETRGAVLGACAKSDFRECRGGDALKAGSSSYIKFDQYDNKRTRGESGRGTCSGIADEAMRRIDQSSGATDLPSAVTYMRSELNGSKSDVSQICDRIQNFQDNPRNLATRYYAVSAEHTWPTHGGATRNERIDGLMDSLCTSPGMDPGNVAYVGVRMQRTDAAPADGHVLLVQHLPANAQTNPSASRYAVFDPNNGVFTYDDWAHTEAALRGYMDSAYREDGYAAVPEQARFYSPDPEHRRPSPPQRSVANRPDRLEPKELGLRPPPGHDGL
jgi:hypothetical protein